jgi:hypothetical protein
VPSVALDDTKTWSFSGFELCETVAANSEKSSGDGKQHRHVDRYGPKCGASISRERRSPAWQPTWQNQRG